MLSVISLTPETTLSASGAVVGFPGVVYNKRLGRP
jgi:hypothetical protein